MKLFHRSNFFKAIRQGFGYISTYLAQGFRNGLGMVSLKRFSSLFLSYMNHFSNALNEESNDLANLWGTQKQKLKKTALGLHALLPKDARYSYSILIPITSEADPKFIKTTLKAALDQTASSLEILVGHATSVSESLHQILTEFASLFPGKIKRMALSISSQPDAKTAILNLLAANASGNYLLLLDPNDWIRPDLLYRYEQTLRLLSNPEASILYCNEYQINEKEHPIPWSHFYKPLRPQFPYLFSDEIGHGLLIPKTLWRQIGGLRFRFSGVETYDLCLRLDLVEGQFYNVPFLLYACRNASSVQATSEAYISALKDYAKAKQLDWDIVQGYLPSNCRAIPRLNRTPQVHAIIPFRDQREYTLKAVESLLKQKNVTTQITAVDNGSHDLSIAEELKALNVEVLRIDEPFNYSRLNNLAVERTFIGKECDSLLFLNNDVELDEGALEEMCRWIDQPHIGMVGCRLHYPDGSLQHGGVELATFGPIARQTWEHVERYKTFDQMKVTKKLRVTKAVTAACALVKRQVFLDVRGFDEIWHPIAYSDTHLAMKLATSGLWCFYTPYASGVHFESASRQTDNIEDYENSAWLHSLLFH